MWRIRMASSMMIATSYPSSVVGPRTTVIVAGHGLEI